LTLSYGTQSTDRNNKSIEEKEGNMNQADIQRNSIHLGRAGGGAEKSDTPWRVGQTDTGRGIWSNDD
jgi:hypothetical protein